jgi:hypothetical protein
MSYTEDDLPQGLSGRVGSYLIARNMDATVQEGVDAGDPLPASKQLSCDGDGSLYVTPGPAGFPVTTQDPVNTNEILYTSFKQERNTIAYSAGGTGTVLPTKPCTGGFLLVAPIANTGKIWVGDTAGTCYISISAGEAKTYSLPNSNLVFAYSDLAAGTDKLVIEYYNPTF